MKFDEKQIAGLMAIAMKRGTEKLLAHVAEDGVSKEGAERVLDIFVTNALILTSEMAEIVMNPRGFEVANGFEDKEVTLPHRGTSEAAGYDFHSLDTVTIPAHSVVIINTGVKAFMPYGEVLKIYPRSSMGIKKNLVLANGTAIIDSDYYSNEKNDGHIMIALLNNSNEPQEVKAGERIAQGIFSTFYDCGDEIEEVRTGGIGSTGK